jgi:hypothetical protein
MANVEEATRAFRATLREAWALPMVNTTKEPLWRMAIDAIPGARFQPWTCPCSLHRTPAPAGRLHTFWECPVALAVRAQLTMSLGGPGATRASVWLLTSPSPAVCPEAWVAVSLAALDAMDYGRRLLWVVRHSPSWAAPVPGGAPLLPGALPPPLLAAHVPPHLAAGGDAAMATVATAAAARFWLNLQDFAKGCSAPLAGWLVPTGHPFLHLEAGRLSVNFPAGVPAPVGDD